ncbi:hypothetical protein Lal_00039775 [Lupinus albus]|nr:hypothetical protein Lal_00039775 [Lupinus albus]
MHFAFNNPEIDRTYHRLVRQNMTLDINFFSVSKHHVAENTAFKHSVYVHSEYSDFVHFVAFPDFDHSVHSKNMAQLTAPDFTYDSLGIQYEDIPYVLKTGLIHLFPNFNGLAEYHLDFSTMKPHDVQEDHICLEAFLHSLEGPAKDWLYYLAPSSITSWGDLKRSFLGKFFHASRTTAIRKDIFGIRQQHGESLYDYWESFKRLCTSFPHHQISEQLLLQYFCEGLNNMDRSIIDVASGGGLGDMTPFEAKCLIEKMASNSQQFNANSGDSIIIR